ncbi:MAG: cupin domain-containing protein [Dehalococcoidia bacterium]
MKTLLKPLLPLLVAGLVIAGCGGDDKDDAPSVSAGITEVTRQVLAQSTATTAPGQSVELTRVIIPAKQSLAAHTHPGPQLAIIEEGTLTYTIIKGSVQVTRAAGTSGAKTETASAGQTVELKAGDSLIETPGMEHEAKNNTDKAIVIYLSSLFPQGAPPSSPVQ